MSLAGLIGMSLFAAGIFATAVFGTLRLLLLPWCPGCDGCGVDVRSGPLACDVCQGSGLLRVPDAPPADW